MECCFGGGEEGGGLDAALPEGGLDRPYFVGHEREGIRGWGIRRLVALDWFGEGENAKPPRVGRYRQDGKRTGEIKR